MVTWYFNGEQRYRSLFDINLHKEESSRIVNESHPRGEGVGQT